MILYVCVCLYILYLNVCSCMHICVHVYMSVGAHALMCMSVHFNFVIDREPDPAPVWIIIQWCGSQGE